MSDPNLHWDGDRWLHWDGQQWLPVPPVPVRKSRRGLWVALGVAGAFILIIGVLAAFGAGSSTPSATAAGSTQSAPPAPTPTPTVDTPTPDPTPTYDVPKAADFQVTVKNTSKQCFGSAGCNIEYKVIFTFIRQVTYDPNVTYDVTFVIRGGSDGAITDTTSIQGKQYTESTGFTSTAGPGNKLTAVITDIAPQ